MLALEGPYLGCMNLRPFEAQGTWQLLIPGLMTLLKIWENLMRPVRESISKVISAQL